MAGVVLAILSAATFALNNATARRGVVTGTPSQGMVITNPVGILCFLPFVLASGSFKRLSGLSSSAILLLAAVGLLHFLFGRWCNYRASQAAGVNLITPVVQLQVVVTLLLAVVILKEPLSLLQLIGAVLMVFGSFVTQRCNRQADARKPAISSAAPTFEPQHAAGYLFATLAALAYGTTPIMVRTALQGGGPLAGIIGGFVAYSAATLAVAVLVMASPALQHDVRATKRENVRWFVYSGICVAAAQGLFYSAVAVAPLMLVVPLMQLSLIFRFIFSAWLNPDHEVFNWAVVVGSAVSILGACMIAIDTDVLLAGLHLPGALARMLGWRI